MRLFTFPRSHVPAQDRTALICVVGQAFIGIALLASGFVYSLPSICLVGIAVVVAASFQAEAWIHPGIPTFFEWLLPHFQKRASKIEPPQWAAQGYKARPVGMWLYFSLILAMGGCSLLQPAPSIGFTLCGLLTLAWLAFAAELYRSPFSQR